jgi:hypothetical protein
MNEKHQVPQVFHILREEALDIRHSPTGCVGQVFREEGLEMVWVARQEEDIDTTWFAQPTVDLLIVLQGHLRVEFEEETQAPVVLEPGDLLKLPSNTRCRAYRWPRDQQEATIFVAVYPIRDDQHPMRQLLESPSHSI